VAENRIRVALSRDALEQHTAVCGVLRIYEYDTSAKGVVELSDTGPSLSAGSTFNRCKMPVRFWREVSAAFFSQARSQSPHYSGDILFTSSGVIRRKLKKTGRAGVNFGLGAASKERHS
jgi:hypothetical protein